MIIIMSMEEVKTLRDQVRGFIDPDSHKENVKLINDVASEILNFFTSMAEVSDSSIDLIDKPEIVETFLRIRDTMNSANLNLVNVKELEILGQTGLVLITI